MVRGSFASVFALALAAGAAASALAGPLPAAKTAHDRAAWRALLHWPAGCEQGWRESHGSGAGLSVEPAGNGGQLVLVDCDLAAYQGNTVFFLLDAAHHATGPLAFQVYEDPGNGHPRLKRETVILGVLTWARGSGVLTVFDKFRGPADCGVYSRFQLHDGRFVLIEARAKTACDGKPPFDPRRWPALPVPRPS